MTAGQGKKDMSCCVDHRGLNMLLGYPAAQELCVCVCDVRTEHGSISREQFELSYVTCFLQHAHEPPVLSSDTGRSAAST